MRWPRLLDDEGVKAAALSAGIDWDRLEADRRENSAHIDSHIRRTALDAFSLGLRGTPGYRASQILSEGALSESGLNACSSALAAPPAEPLDSDKLRPSRG